MSYYELYLLNFMLCIHAEYGLSYPSLEGLIVKGYKTDIYRYPHSVFLNFKKTVPTACGGSLIMVQAVITAAHCLDELKYPRGKISAFLGASIPRRAEVVRRVHRYRIHPKYDAERGKYNLGLAFLDFQVPLGRDIKKVPLASNPPEPNDYLFSSGWGKQVPDRLPDYSEMRHLKVTKQRVVSERECQDFIGFKASSAHWCTVPVNGYHYQGDAGNGLVTTDGFLVGVVSYMVNEATVYSDVIRQRSWIIKSILSLIDELCQG